MSSVPAAVGPDGSDKSGVASGTGDTEITGAGPAAIGDEPLPRRKLVFGVVAMGLFMASIDQTIVATALSSVQHELHAQVQWSSWTITIYGLGQVLIMPLAGKISEIYGRKRVLLTAVIIFTVSSLLCGMSTDIGMLVVLRGIQAIGGGSIMPSASGIVADHFGRNRDRALGLFTSVFPIGGVVGPILGGIFVNYWSWRGIFLVNVPIGFALIVLGAIFIPSTAGRGGSRLDVPGVIMLGVLILGAMLGITELGDGAGPLSAWFIVPEVIAAIALVMFLRHAGRAKDPFVSMNLLIGHGFGIMNLINFFYGAAAIGFGALVPLYAQERFGIAPLAGGTLLTARAVGMIAVTALAVMALRRTGYRLPMLAGLLLTGAGLVMMFFPPAAFSPYAWLSLSSAVCGIGMGVAVPAANNATLQFAEGHISAVAGLRGMFRQAGSILSVSIVTAAVAQSASAGVALGVAFLVFAGLLFVVAPTAYLVPDHRGAW